MSKKINGKKFDYYHLRDGAVNADVEEAISNLTGPARMALEDFEFEEHEDFAGTYFVNVWVENKTQAAKIATALRKSCAEAGHAFEYCAKFGDFDVEKEGRHAGTRLVYFYITDRDFPGCEYEEVEE